MAPPNAALWRADDEALLVRLEDERLLDQVWQELIGPRASPPLPRAAGIYACMRRTASGAATVREALAGDVAPLARSLTEPQRESEPELAHHLALLLATLADRLEERGEHAR